jgi:hypothetical protein
VRPEEVAYYRALIEHEGQPALDLACGTGRDVRHDALQRRPHPLCTLSVADAHQRHMVYDAVEVSARHATTGRAPPGGSQAMGKRQR